MVKFIRSLQKTSSLMDKIRQHVGGAALSGKQKPERRLTAAIFTEYHLLCGTKNHEGVRI
jgi:hypothetical protein